MKYCGIDLHSNNSVMIVSDEEDRIVFNKRVANDLGQIRAALEAHREELAGVVIESTYNWYWLVDGLMDMGYRVHLAHPAAIKKYEGLKHSGNFADAVYLAQLLRLGLLAEGYIYPRESGRRAGARTNGRRARPPRVLDFSRCNAWRGPDAVSASRSWLGAVLDSAFRD